MPSPSDVRTLFAPSPDIEFIATETVTKSPEPFKNLPEFPELLPSLATFIFPLVILLASKFGILPVAKVPALILLAFKFGILASAIVPESISSASKFVSNDPSPENLGEVSVLLLPFQNRC